jgi:hypothetical protein
MISLRSPKCHIHFSRFPECIFADRTTGLNIVTMLHPVAFWMTSCWSWCITTRDYLTQRAMQYVYSRCVCWALLSNEPDLGTKPKHPCLLNFLFIVLWIDPAAKVVPYFFRNILYIYSCCCLPYCGFTTSYTTSSPPSAIYCFLFQVTILSSFLNIFKLLLISSSSSSLHLNPSIFPLITLFK